MTATQLPVGTAAQSWRALAGALRTERWVLVSAALLMLLAAGCAMLIPALLGRIVDAVLAGSRFSDVLVLAALIALSGVSAAVVMRVGGGLLVGGLQRALASLREEVLSAAVRLERSDLEAAGSADVVSRVTADVDAVSAAVSGVLPRTVQAGFVIALTFVGLAALHPWLACAALLAVPVQCVSTIRFLRRSKPLYHRLRGEESARGQSLIESVRGADTIVAYRDDARHLRRISTRSLTAVETGRVAAKARNSFNAGLNAAEFVGLAAVLVTGYFLSVTVGLSVGSVTAAALFFHRIFDPIGALLSSVDDLQRAAAGLGRLTGVLLAPRRQPQREAPKDASIAVNGVTYRYGADGKAVVRDVTLQLPAGSSTVFVGASGSGKSTLAQLIAGVLVPSDGSVLIGGVPAQSAGSASRRAVMLVTQETHRFVGTLADNLRLVAPDADDAALLAALVAVGAEWVAELPEGLATSMEPAAASVIDDARLQQIALARVLLADPLVVVLDEVTAYSGIGTVCEDAIDAVVRGRTSVVVAHRFVQAARADLIAVFEQGELIECGSHAALLGSGGSYASLYALAPR